MYSCLSSIYIITYFIVFCSLYKQTKGSFLLELDMTFQDWEQIKFRPPEGDLVRLNRDILETWKQNCNKYHVKQDPIFLIQNLKLQHINKI
jgi:hypothetical protein